ncbi:MAG: GNAT family N-acetyltransferase [Nocardioidaceae bacterium]
MDIEPRTPLRLRRWQDNDAPALIGALASDDMSHQGPIITTSDGALQWLRWAGGLASREAGFCLAVADADDIAVGNVMVTDIDRHSTGWASYWTAVAARGHGVASDAVAALAHWLHDEHEVERIELGHRVNNPASCRVATKAGFAAEGVERGKLYYKGVRYDVERHARLATDPRVALDRRVTIDLA